LRFKTQNKYNFCVFGDFDYFINKGLVIMIDRTLIPLIIKGLNRGKIIILIGPRQVGKTTLAKEIAQQINLKTLWLNGDEADIRILFSDITSTHLKAIIGNNKLLIIDEAQRIKNIGITLKLIYDQIKGVQVLATGSSAFELTSEINEPLTGRKREFFLYPLSYQEMIQHTSFLEENRMLEHRLIYGYYPEVIKNPGDEKGILSEISESYLYKDVLSYGKIKKPALLEKLLQDLALQIGNEVSYHELGQLIGADNQTVERYIDLLEKTFVIFRLVSLSRNMRNEIKKGRKIYFYDIGIRNAIIKNFIPLNLRKDVGALWENFLISERLKINHYNQKFVNRFFWRSTTQKEIDYIEEQNGKLYAYEFKWNPKKKVKIPRSFTNLYPEAETQLINPLNFIEFIVP